VRSGFPPKKVSTPAIFFSRKKLRLPEQEMANLTMNNGNTEYVYDYQQEDKK
jgi:hypothetical protein